MVSRNGKGMLAPVLVWSPSIGNLFLMVTFIKYRKEKTMTRSTKEKFKLSGHKLIEKVKELIHGGNKHV